MRHPAAALRPPNLPFPIRSGKAQAGSDTVRVAAEAVSGAMARTLGGVHGLASWEAPQV